MYGAQYHERWGGKYGKQRKARSLKTLVTKRQQTIKYL
jgi:hypothetical protein